MSDRPSVPAQNERRRREAAADAAAAWLARRDRGLSADEQTAFDHWRSDPVNARLLAEIEGPFAALDRVGRMRPPAGETPDADLLTRPTKRTYRRSFWLAGGLAAAAAVLAVALLPVTGTRRVEEATPVARRALVRHAPERLDLPDGSTVVWKRGTRVESEFTPLERRVRLSAGDAHFTVAKDASRPFIVMVGHVAVRAVGTAFTISASTAAVEVVVTEGRVRIDDADGRNLIEPSSAASRGADNFPASNLPPALVAGQCVVIPVGPGLPSLAPITEATAEIVGRAAAWRSIWLEFGDTPLAEVVREFNRQAAENAQPILHPADDKTGRVLVSGTFRADGVDAFVRLLQSGFGIRATRDAEGRLVLRTIE